MNIKRIRVKNYKSFEDSSDILLEGNIFALIGQNNTGKSAIMDAIQCMFPNTGKSIKESDFHKGKDNEISIEIDFEEITDEYIEETLFKGKIDKLYIKISELNEEKIKKLKKKRLIL
ncbi:MAG: ATP-dependent nuclease [Clostridium baratii]